MNLSKSILVCIILTTLFFLSIVVFNFKRQTSNSTNDLYFSNQEIRTFTENFIYSTKEALDICVYSISDPNILFYLEQLIKKGIKVRIITENSNLKFVESFLDYDIQLFSDDETGLMHCKYMIKDNELLWTGSANLTQTGMDCNTNNIYITDNQKIIETFSDHFNALVTGNISDYYMSKNHGKVYFSQYDKTFEVIINELSKAKKSVKIAMYAFSDLRIVNFLRILSAFGIRIYVIADKEWNSLGSYSVVDKLSDFSFACLDLNENGKMHEKFLVIDDKTVIFGSYNLTLSANDKNHEVIIVSNEKTIVDKFVYHFEDVLDKIKRGYY